VTAIRATYVSVFDDHLVFESGCLFHPETGEVCSVEPAINGDEPALGKANQLTDEYIIIPRGRTLREEDGIVFVYATGAICSCGAQGN
jgi:hypothetical protein